MASIEQLEASDKSPLRRFIHCIGTGIRFKQQGDRSEENNLYQKEYNSSFVAADQIRAMKGGGHRDSFLKNSISDKLLASNAKTSVIRFFSQLGLCKSPNYITISTDRAVEDKMKRGWDPTGRGYGLIVGAYDNIGFRKIKGYVQYTLLSIIFVPVAVLISIGVYPNPTMKPEDAYRDPMYKPWDDGIDWDGDVQRSR